MPRREKQLLARDAKRDVGEELLQAVRDVKAGRYGAKYKIQASDVATARVKCGLSQAQFAAALRISARTLQQWEQGRPATFRGCRDTHQDRCAPSRSAARSDGRLTASASLSSVMEALDQTNR
jgi:putative transcriptional regulator